MNVDYIKALMERQNITQSKLAELSGVPAGTISRILSGKTEDAGVSTVTAIVRALNGSMDVMCGIVSAPDETPLQPSERELMDKLLAEKERQLRSVNVLLEQKQQWLHKLWRALMITVVIIGTLLIADMSIGSIGFIRY